MSDAFFTLYQGLDREGPGEPGDVAWVAGLLDLLGQASHSIYERKDGESTLRPSQLQCLLNDVAR